MAQWAMQSQENSVLQTHISLLQANLRQSQEESKRAVDANRYLLEQIASRPTNNSNALGELRKDVDELRREVEKLKEKLAKCQDVREQNQDSTHDDLLDFDGAATTEATLQQTSSDYLHFFRDADQLPSMQPAQIKSHGRENIGEVCTGCNPKHSLQLVDETIPGRNTSTSASPETTLYSSFDSSTAVSQDSKSDFKSNNFARYGIQYHPVSSEGVESRAIILYNLPRVTILAKLPMIYCEPGIIDIKQMRLGNIPGLVQTSAVMLVFLSSRLASSYEERWSARSTFIQGNLVKVQLIPTPSYPIASNLHIEIMRGYATRFIKIIHDPYSRTAEAIVRSLGHDPYRNTLGVVDYFEDYHGTFYIEFLSVGDAKRAMKVIETKQSYTGTTSKFAYKFSDEAETFRARRSTENRLGKHPKGSYIDVDASANSKIDLDYGDVDSHSPKVKEPNRSACNPVSYAEQSSLHHNHDQNTTLVTRKRHLLSNFSTSPRGRLSPDCGVGPNANSNSGLEAGNFCTGSSQFSRDRPEPVDIEDEFEEGEVVG